MVSKHGKTLQNNSIHEWPGPRRRTFDNLRAKQEKGILAKIMANDKINRRSAYISSWLGAHKCLRLREQRQSRNFLDGWKQRAREEGLQRKNASNTCRLRLLKWERRSRRVTHI